MLAAITCHYNPCKYKRLIQNYWRFRKELSKEIPLYTIELSFDGTFEIPDSIKIEGNEKNLMWQKERLLNLLIQQLPKEFDKVAWIDADLIFLNKEWHKETEQKLNQVPVVQLFEGIFDLDSAGEPYQYKEGYVFGEFMKQTNWKRPGGAWASRREILNQQGGLDDMHIVGSSDSAMLHAWSGKFNSYLVSQMNHLWREQYLTRAVSCWKAVKNQMDFVKGDLLHLFHGDYKNRHYVSRNAYLRDNNFDPSNDITIDENGLWRWNSDKPEMHEKVAEYFSIRKEDE